MRTSEWIQISFSLLLAAAAWVRTLGSQPLPARRRWVITLLAAIPPACVALTRQTAAFLPDLYVSILRDWLAAALLLVPYWQAGQFFCKPNLRLQESLAAFDRRMLPSVSRASGTAKSPLGLSMEIAYLMCYPLVPMALLTLYVIGRRPAVDYFWLVVLTSTYICYAATPFFPAFPPRAPLGDAIPAPKESGKPENHGRAINHWIARHGSIHAISFPSAHVASSLAVSLVLLRFNIAAGLLFLVVSIWLAAGAVVGRYHYLLDVLMGAVTAVAVFCATFRFL
jgi:membrane-associated phospholipid phosphatase